MITILDAICPDYRERFYEEQIDFEAFGHESLILGRLYARPGNGFAVIEKIWDEKEANNGQSVSGE